MDHNFYFRWNKYLQVKTLQILSKGPPPFRIVVQFGAMFDYIISESASVGVVLVAKYSENHRLG